MPHITPRPDGRWTPLRYITAVTLTAIMAGFASPRISAGRQTQWRWGTRFTPFWQLLGGGLFSNGEGRTCSCGQAVSVTYLAVQPGVGITAMMTPRLGIRAQADVQIAGSTDAYLQGTSIFPRTTVGAVIRLGRTR